MPFVKGTSGNPKGRAVGARTKNHAYLSAFCEYVVDGGGGKFIEEMDKLKGEQYVKVFLELMKLSTNGKRANTIANEFLIRKIKTSCH